MSSPVAAIREAAGNRGIRNLQLASATWGAAEAAYLVGLLVHAYAEGGSGAVAMVAVIRALPSVVLAPLLTTWTSRYPRVLVLRAVLLVRVLSVAGAGLAVAAGDSALLPFVYLLVAIDAVAATLLRPIRGALAPALARSPGELIAANLATSTGDSLAALVGPAIGAVLVGLASAGVTFAAAVLMLV